MHGNGGDAADAGGRIDFRFADLFAGIGAMRLGFEQACGDLGITPKCVGFSEIDAAATWTYQRRFDGVPLGDAKTLASSGPIPECDVILAGFPCMAFSAAGKRQGFRDERGKLFYALARIIGKRRPRAFLLENVKGLASHNDGRTLAAILKVLRSQLGYAVHYAIFNSRDFGVPQNRPRIYIVGFRDGGEGFRFPDPTDSTRRLRDILETEPVDPRYCLTEHELQRLRRHKDRHQAKGNGFGFAIIDPEIEVAGTLMSSGWGQEKNFIADARLNKIQVPPGEKSPINSERIRRLTPVEWERLQGLPDNSTMGQSDGHRNRQLGNAVSVPVIRAVAQSMLAAMGRVEPKARPAILAASPAGDGIQVSLPLAAVELCAGCGGLSTGLERTGAIEVRVACEFDPAAAQTYRLNHPCAIVVPKDITAEDTKREMVEALGGRRCDLLAAGLPCQAYSLSGLRDPNDARGSLFEHFIEMVRRLAPRVACIENVPGILSMRRTDGTLVMDAIARAFRSLDYAVGFHLVNAGDFGDPQSRTRVVIFGWREGGFPRFEKTHDQSGINGLPRWRTVRNAIADIEDAPEDPAAWHVFVRSSPEYLERIRLTPVGKSVAIGYGESFYRNPPDEPAITVKAVLTAS